MKILDHSKIDGNGQEHIVIEIEPAQLREWINEDESSGMELNGGMYVGFEVDHKNQQITANWIQFYRGLLQRGGHIRTWKDVVLSEEECLRFCEEEYGK